MEGGTPPCPALPLPTGAGWGCGDGPGTGKRQEDIKHIAFFLDTHLIIVDKNTDAAAG